MIWVLVPLVAIISWAIVESAKHRAAGSDAKLLIEALADQLDEATEERDRLRKRVENLEAIVTSEHYELEKQAQAAGVSRVDPSLLEGDPLADEQEVEQLARRARERQ